MPLTEYNKEKAYKETYELLLLTYRKVKNVAPDVMGKSLGELKRLLSGCCRGSTRWVWLSTRRGIYAAPRRTSTR